MEMLVIGFLFLLILFVIFLLFSIVSFSLALFLFGKKEKKSGFSTKSSL